MVKNDAGVNFIRHLLSISEKFIDDDRLGPLHISLYYALFHSWNLSKFRNPISISRDELMRASKIGSANTYTKCLKDLDVWAYLKYNPSHNPHKGSQIYMYIFNKATDKTTDNAIDISANKGTDKTDEKALRPSINTKNKSNKLNNENDERTRSKSSEKSFPLHSRKTIGRRKPKQKSSAPRAAIARQSRPLLKEIEKYFAAKQWPTIEAQKFFNYYKSNGWLVGGKTPMKSWKAATQNWMLNSQKFNKSVTSSMSSRAESRGAGKLHTKQDKNYGEPL
jgi:hypothetical protein